MYCLKHFQLYSTKLIMTKTILAICPSSCGNNAVSYVARVEQAFLKLLILLSIIIACYESILITIH